MFNLGVTIDDDMFRQYVEAINKKLIDPGYELSRTKDLLLANIADHFKNEQGPVGKWTRRKDKRTWGKWPVLDKSGALKNSIDGKVFIDAKGSKVQITIDGEPAKYARVHNNGMRIRNRSGRFTKYPKRQFAWISAQTKEDIRQVWIKGL